MVPIIINGVNKTSAHEPQPASKWPTRPLSAVIVGTGSHVPERILTNADIEKMVDTSDQWITERTGMKERHIVAPEEAASDLALVACEKALAEAKVKPEELDLIIVGTVTGDMAFPSTACILQQRLGAAHAAAFDVSAGCTGFIYSLSVARQFLASGIYRTALVVGVEVLSKITDWTDRSTCVLFGDGAGAAVLKVDAEPEKGILATYMAADGGGGKHLYMPAGGSRLPTSVETVQQRLHTLKMDGNATFKVAVRSMADAVRHLLRQTGLEPDDIKLLIPHQANLRIIDATAKLLKFPSERVFINIAKYGNTSSATTIIALDEARKAGLVQPGDVVLLVAFGAGLTWGGLIIRF
jgi:3-oxoacyl-[acyl-carrier-protein] synthase III